MNDRVIIIMTASQADAMSEALYSRLAGPIESGIKVETYKAALEAVYAAKQEKTLTAAEIDCVLTAASQVTNHDDSIRNQFRSPAQRAAVQRGVSKLFRLKRVLLGKT